MLPPINRRALTALFVMMAEALNERSAPAQPGRFARWIQCGLHYLDGDAHRFRPVPGEPANPFCDEIKFHDVTPLAW